jgi:hypothetical protein
MFGGNLRQVKLLINSCLFWRFYGMVGGFIEAPFQLAEPFFGSLLISFPFEKIMVERTLKKS